MKPLIQLKLVVRSAGLLALAVLTSCETLPLDLAFEDPYLQRDLDRDLGQSRQVDPEAGYSYWSDPGVGEPLRAVIDLSEQTAYFYRGSELVGRSRVATGRSGHRTPTGEFTILEKTRQKRSNLYGRVLDSSGAVLVPDADARRDSVPSGGQFVGASMPYWMRLTNSGIGMHAGPIPNPGSPASHGCIRMPDTIARLMFENAPVGTPVRIVP